jgi:hypothetical protein
MKRVEKSNKLEKLIPSPFGVLAIHIKRASKINIYDKEKLGDWRCLMLRIIINDVSKESKIAIIDYKNECKFDDLRHFLIKIHPFKEDIKNELKLELYAFGKVEVNNEYYFRRLAYRYINIIDLVRFMNVCEEFEMTDNKRLVACFDIEFCFSFGRFGYGYSNQIDTSDPDKKNKMMVTQGKLAFSSFLRVKPPEYRKIDEPEVTEVVTVCPPKIIQFSQTVDNSKATKILPFIYNVGNSEFPLVYKYFHGENQNYLKIKNEFGTCRSRIERLEYLHLLLNNRERYMDLVDFDTIEYYKNNNNNKESFL